MTSFLNIYPWLFFYLIIFGQGAQAYQIYKTKKTKGLSVPTFLIALVTSTAFGWTCFLGGENAYALLISNSLSVIILTYIIFYIWKNHSFKLNYLFSILFFLSGILILVFGTINYINFLNNEDTIFKIQNVAKWIKTTIPTIGGIASASIFIPQLFKIMKTKESKNLNYFLMLFFVLYLINIVVFWIIFGIDYADWSLSIPSIVFSSIGAGVQISIMILKYKYEK